MQIKTTTKVVVCSAPKRGWYWLDPSRGAESLAPHYIHGQPLKRLFFFAYLVLLPVNGSINSFKLI